MRWLPRSSLALVLLATSVARGDEAAPITLAQALAAAERAPAARVPGHEIASAEANVAASSALPNPTLRLGTNRLTARFVAGVTIPLPIFGTVRAAERVARSEADVVRADADVQLRQLRHRVALAWIELARARAEVDALIVTAQQAKELETIARGRQQAGVGAEVDITVAAAARARADVGVAAAQRSEQAAAAELAGMLGWDPARPLRAEGPFPTGTLEERGGLQVHLAQHPERVAAERRVEAAAATVAQVHKEYWPTLALEGEILYDDPTITEGNTPWQRTDALVAVALDLPLFAHVGDRVRSAREKQLAEQTRLAVTEHEVAARVDAALARWQAATDKLAALERDVEPAQAKAAELSAQAYREGARDLSSALVADRDLQAVRAEVNDARANAAVAYADLQLAIGGTLAP